MTKTFLVVWLFINGVDVGGPPREAPSLEACRKASENLMKTQVPDGVDFFAVACVQQKLKENPA